MMTGRSPSIVHEIDRRAVCRLLRGREHSVASTPPSVAEGHLALARDLGPPARGSASLSGSG